MVAILVVLTILLFLTIDHFVQRAAARDAVERTAPRTAPAMAAAVVDAGAILGVPGGVFVSPEHTWLAVDTSGTVRVGGDALPGMLLGGVDRVDALPVGAEVRVGEPLVTLRKGARELRLTSPVEGTVCRVNERLDEAPDRLREDPFGEGWLYTIRPRELASSLRRLFVAEEAKAWMRREIARLRETLAGLSLGQPQPVPTLPDGGLPVDGIASHLAPEEWQAVTSRFFEPVEER